MSERALLSVTKEHITEISFHEGTDGVTDARDFLLTQATGTFLLRVGTPSYIVGVRRYNSMQPDRDMHLPENILPVPDVSQLEVVIERLSRIPPYNLAPFVELIEEKTP